MAASKSLYWAGVGISYPDLSSTVSNFIPASLANCAYLPGPSCGTCCSTRNLMEKACQESFLTHSRLVDDPHEHRRHYNAYQHDCYHYRVDRLGYRAGCKGNLRHQYGIFAQCNHPNSYHKLLLLGEAVDAAKEPASEYL